MTQTAAQWIWFAPRSPHENTVGCFVQPFAAPERAAQAKVRITAETRYVLSLNGEEVGRGPGRSWPGVKYVDSYDISPLLLPGENLLSVRVWDYGWSTYQSIAQSPGLWFEVSSEGGLLAASGTGTRARQGAGHRWNTPKRNVNLGFMEWHDARLDTPFWQVRAEASRDWPAATLVEGPGGALAPSPVPVHAVAEKWPQRLAACRLVSPGCQQVTLNARPVFFPERKDADASIFSGFIGVELDSPAELEGRVVFPNRTWNGIIGDFRIGDVLYSVDNAHRDVAVRLAKGRQLFLLQVSGNYDDIFCHLEFHFARLIGFAGPGEAGFFCVGPTGRIIEQVDGRSRVYGGLDEFDRMEAHSEDHQRFFACQSLGALEEAGAELLPIPADYVLPESYIYSLVKSQRVEAELPVIGADCALLHGNTTATRLEAPPPGQCHQLVLDFGDIYVGPLTFSLSAPAGTVLDLYGYENEFQGEVDYTVGLNNSIRYVCREGMQTYTCLTRTGCRYLALTLREQTGPVALYGVHIRHATHPPSGIGRFRSDDDKLNRIWEICRQTHLCCMEDTFVDCPTYEQSFWNGDALISAYINAWLFGAYPLLRHCLVVGAGMARNTPLMNALGPTDWNTSIPMWSMNWLIAIEKYVEVSGDRSVVAELYASVRALMDTFEGFLTPEGGFLLNAWNMLDWAELDIHNHGVVTGNQAILIHCCRVAADFAQEMEKPQDAARWQRMGERLEDYIDAVLWDEASGAFLDGFSPEHGLSRTRSVQSHTLLVLYGVIRDPEKQKRAEALLAAPPADFLTAGSPFFLFYVYEQMAPNRLQWVLDDIRERWTGMMRYDCTTCWEVFPGFYEVGRTRSYCHSWSASPAYFLTRYLLGVHPKADAFTALEISLPETDLAWCEGTVPTPLGAVTVYWSREGEQKKYRIVAPKGVKITAAPGFDWALEVEYLGQ